MPCGQPFHHCVVKVYGNSGSWTDIFNVTDTKAYSCYDLELCVYVHACLCAHTCMHVCMMYTHTHTHTLTKYTGYLVLKCVFIFARGRVWLSLSVLCLFFVFMHVFWKWARLYEVESWTVLVVLSFYIHLFFM